MCGAHGPASARLQLEGRRRITPEIHFHTYTVLRV